MDPDILITAENLSKLYYVNGRRPKTSWRKTMVEFARSFTTSEAEHLAAAQRLVDGKKAFWALDRVTFEVRRGEVLGIIGRNGAGKSTLLKILSRITEPTGGRAEVRGRSASLLEIGTAFHHELTGRENVLVNGIMLGMTAAEVRRKFDEIVAFSGVERFIDMPVKYYSSGMRVRLGFAVAAHIEPDILMIDEVLAVGDVAFQEKCLKKMDTLTQDEHRTVLFVSHSMTAIANLCSTAMLLDGGKLALIGKAGDVVDRYFKANQSDEGRGSIRDRRDRTGSGALRLVGFWLEDAQGNRITSARTGRAINLVLEYETLESYAGLQEVRVTAVVTGSRGLRLFGLPSDVVTSLSAVLGRRGRLICTLPKLPLQPGNYEIDVSVFVGREMTDKVMKAGSLTVVDGDYFPTGRLPHPYAGDLLVPFAWRLEPEMEEAKSRAVL